MAICINCPAVTVVSYGHFGPCPEAVGREKRRTAAEYWALHKEAEALEREKEAEEVLAGS